MSDVPVPALTDKQIARVLRDHRGSRTRLADSMKRSGASLADRKAVLAAYDAERAAHVAAVEARRAELAAAPAVTPAPAAAIPAVALADGAVLFCDAAENKVTRVVNAWGRKATYDNGGYRVAVVTADGFVAKFVNTQCPDQFAAECFAVLKAVEVAAKAGLKSVTVRNDRIEGFNATTKRGYKGATYLWVASNVARDAGLSVAFEWCAGADNLADKASREE